MYISIKQKIMVYTLGESLLDLIFSSSDRINARSGGGMLNAAVSLARCGIDVSLISELGDDKTARIIIDFLNENKVNTTCIKKYFHQNTSVALAHFNEQKFPDFSIYKSYPENRRLISPPDFSPDDVLMFGSIYSLDPAIRADLQSILAIAKKSGALICYDPNIRQHRLEDAFMQKAWFENIGFADIIKGSDEDFKNLFGDMKPHDYCREIKKINPDALFILTLGEKGAVAFKDELIVKTDAMSVNVVSTIGAGDAFSAGIVYLLKKRNYSRVDLLSLTEDDLKDILLSGTKFSTAVCGTIDNYVGKNFC